jgi:hypothetical protein
VSFEFPVDSEQEAPLPASEREQLLHADQRRIGVAIRIAVEALEANARRDRRIPPWRRRIAQRGAQLLQVEEAGSAERVEAVEVGEGSVGRAEIA